MARQVKVAVTQAEPVWLNLDATVDKTCTLITEAATNGAQLVTFPECWIPGYPCWLWSRPPDIPLQIQYMMNSLKVDSPQMAKIQKCASESSIVVVLGFSENFHNSLYVAQAIIGDDGKILTTRKKIKATHMERTMFGDSAGDCLDSVVDTSAGRVGALNCWEHALPLLKYHTYSQREQIHVGAWPPLIDGNPLHSMSKPGIFALATTYAIESQSFVLHTTAVLGEAAIDFFKLNEGGGLKLSPGGGNSAVLSPDGRKLSTDIPETEEGIIYATLDLSQILLPKAFLDVCGHYSRPDLLWLGVASGGHSNVRKEGPTSSN